MSQDPPFDTTAARLPLFPLRTVLLPGGPLQLQVFEPRYLDMVSRCMRGGTTFGVVQILQGSEAGVVTETATTGTSARIIDFNSQENGLLGLVCQGEHVFQLSSQERQPNGLVVGTVAWLPARPPMPVMPQFAHLADLLRDVLPQLPPAYQRIAHHLEDAEWVSYRLLELLPLSAAQRQHSLEAHDALERLTWLAPLVRDAVSAASRSTS